MVVNQKDIDILRTLFANHLNTEIMEEIERINFASLWHSEHPRLYNRLVSIVEKHNPKTLHLEGPLLRVKAHLPLLAKIEAQEQGNALSKSITLADNKRDNLILAITGMTRSLASADMEAQRAHVDVVAAWLKKHNANTLPKANYTSETERLDDMLDEIERNAQLKSALETLHIKGLTEELKSTNEEFENLFTQRSQDISANETIDSKAIRTAADKDMRKLFSFIELYQDEYDEVDYRPLTKELNTMLAYYKTQLAARATRIKNKKDAEKENPIEEPI